MAHRCVSSGANDSGSETNINTPASTTASNSPQDSYHFPLISWDFYFVSVQDYSNLADNDQIHSSELGLNNRIGLFVSTPEALDLERNGYNLLRATEGEKREVGNVALRDEYHWPRCRGAIRRHGVQLGYAMRGLHESALVDLEIPILSEEIKAERNIHESAKALLFYAIKCHPAICEGSRLREFDARGVWTTACMNLRSTYPSTLHAIGLLRRLLDKFGASQLCYPPLIDKLQTPSDNLRLLASLLSATSPRINGSFQVTPLLEKFHLYQGIDIVAFSQQYTEYMPELLLAPPHVLVSHSRELHRLLSITGKLYAEKLFSHLPFAQIESIMQFHNDMVDGGWAWKEHLASHLMSLLLWTGRTQLPENTQHMIWDGVREHISGLQQSIGSCSESNKLAALLVACFCFQSLAPSEEATQPSAQPLADLNMFLDGQKKQFPDLSINICYFYQACCMEGPRIRDFVGSFRETAFSSIFYGYRLDSGIATAYWTWRLQGYDHSKALTFAVGDTRTLLHQFDGSIDASLLTSRSIM